MKNFIWSLFVILSSSLYASSTLYNTAFIADSMINNANAVVRYDSIYYNLIGPGKAEMSRLRVITILNKRGEDFAENYVLYDKHSKVTSFAGQILDAKGNRIRKIKKDEITDNSLVGNYNLFQDDRYLSFTALNTTYPYTVVAEYSVKYDGIVSINRWKPVPNYNVSIEKSVFEILSDNVKLKFKSSNLGHNVKSKSSDCGNRFTWIMENKPVIEHEPYSPSLNSSFPFLWAVPEVFEYDGCRGSFESWESFGKWEWNLIEGKQKLPETTCNKIRELTSTATSEIEKIEILYNYLQNNTRYISVQLGIGGWEPISASDVDKVGYGDCKALSNYLVSLLKVVNINSYYTLIGNGNQKIRFPDFASMGQANHVIVCVPVDKDTIWLECTNQKYPFGYIGAGNSGRYALLITSEGGRLVKTPLIGKNENLQTRNASIVIDQKGNATANVNTVYKGLQFGNRHFLLSESFDDQKKWYLRNLSINSPILNSFSLVESKDKSCEISEQLDIYIPKSSIVSGPRLFIKPNLLNTFSSSPPKMDERKFDIQLGFAYTDIDSVKFTIPDGYIIESVFNDINLLSKFGTYFAKVSKIGNELLYIRKLQLNSGNWPPSEYEKFRNFFKTIYISDQANIVLKRE